MIFTGPGKENGRPKRAAVAEVYLRYHLFGVGDFDKNVHKRHIAIIP